MLSLAYKGICLESALGSEIFLAIAVYSLVASHLLVVLISWCLMTYGNFSGYDAGFNTCAVGFSAVLFAFKYIVNLSPSVPASQVIGGIPVASKYAAWLELVLIYVAVPNSSFLGHLCGILAGVLYVHVIGKPLESTIRSLRSGGGTPQNVRYTYASGRNS
jgi:rhomboid domain-containing protein 1